MTPPIMDFPGHFQHIFKQLNHQRLHAQLCDCVVVVGGQSFQAHRSILAACSSHFKALLSSNDSDDENRGPGADRDEGGGPSVIELDPEVVTPEAFATLLDMIYTSTLSLGASNVMDVLLAASHLHLNSVVKACKLHLSKRNFPASPPKGWRSVQQQQHGPPLSADFSASLQQVTSAMEEDIEGVGVDMSQLGGVEKQGMRGVSGQESATPPPKHKRKTQEDSLSGRKRFCNLHVENYKECSPTVTRSNICTEGGGGELLSPDCLKTSDSLWEHQGSVEEDVAVEVKYETTKGESEEIQVPSQSDSSTGCVGAWEKDGDIDGDTVVKVKVGEEGEEVGEEPKMALIEVKKEHFCSYSPDTAPTNSYPSPPLQDSKDTAYAQVNDITMTTDSLADRDVNSLQSQQCTALHTDAQKEAAHLGEESVDGDGLDSLSELAFSCFLNPSSESVMGPLEEEDSLTCLTAAAATASDAGEPCPNSDEANASSALSSDSSSSVVFPVTSVPLQQLLPTQGPGFSDTLILQPTQNSLAGFLSGIRPGLSLEASVVQPSRAVKNSGATTFRRIAPKVPPGSEASTDLSSSSGAADRLPLTRASDDVLSKCKKAAAEDHVLLVEGEKKYACKICCKTFMNLTDCKKHIRVHTGEKPYPCRKCGKRFSQSSHLYKHSKNTCLNWKDEQSFPDTLL
ncbi:Zinc finger and BTB domain-containing protein 5 Transcription factor ZNF-POZ [Channa argus]|uniref:Zinc finger and BTB domain-containing protein 5 Transcription factor ZNF-POZ n=1 Tax=Channa argus TaxID=215402 RepID=A0A6G1PUD1_CHAAH|nr:Zinc finger and BTB domain-containing protein 5 Transcription factor ZNF-POZ [Channa argus]